MGKDLNAARKIQGKAYRIQGKAYIGKEAGRRSAKRDRRDKGDVCMRVID